MDAIMEAPTDDAPKLPDMVMCGDHPSLTKTELNVKESKTDVKERDILKERPMLSYTKISPTQSRAEGAALAEAPRARRRPRADLAPAASRPIVQAFPLAAMGSFRWPPYLLAMWVLVLMLTHVLHCLVSMLERALPALKKCTDYFHAWTEDSWKLERDLNHKMCPAALALLTALLYALYVALYAAHAALAWAVEPLCPDDERASLADVERRVTDYVDDVHSNTTASITQ